ncbi:uncharacterized protein METZ01_LOCUS370757, partial [marine metagenome]
PRSQVPPGWSGPPVPDSSPLVQLSVPACPAPIRGFLSPDETSIL